MSTERPAPALRLSGLKRAFGDVRAVDGLELELEPGAICALLGPSGCGKTTALRLIAGLEVPDAGTIEVAGETLWSRAVNVPPERRRIGMVFQDYALFPHLDVAANVGYGLGRRPDRARVGDALRLVGLGGEASRAPHQLSGGQQQRVALARALAPEPQLILLDEPFSNLDAALRERLRSEVREILARAGVTVLLVTHDQSEALSFADVVAVMRDGRIEQTGSPEDVYGGPANRWVADFVGEVDVVPALASDGALVCELDMPRADVGFEGPAEVVVRPESIAIGVHAEGGTRASPAKVVAREFFGHDQLVTVELASGMRLRSRRLGFPAWHPGDHVRVWIDGPVTVFPAGQSDRSSGQSSG